MKMNKLGNFSMIFATSGIILIAILPLIDSFDSGGQKLLLALFLFLYLLFGLKPIIFFKFESLYRNNGGIDAILIKLSPVIIAIAAWYSLKEVYFLIPVLITWAYLKNYAMIIPMAMLAVTPIFPLINKISIAQEFSVGSYLLFSLFIVLSFFDRPKNEI